MLAWPTIETNAKREKPFPMKYKLQASFQRRATWTQNELLLLSLKSTGQSLSLPMNLRINLQRSYQMVGRRISRRYRNTCVLTGYSRANVNFLRMSRFQIQRLQRTGDLPWLQRSS
jgi:ribosomal protein S14